MLRASRVCIGQPEPYGTRVQATAWGTLVGLATGTETGWETDTKVLGEGALDRLFAALAGPEPEAAIPAAFVAVSRWLAELRDAPGEYPYDEGLPSVNAIVGLCTATRVTLAWVGHEKAYLLRGGAIAAESEEHTRLRMLRTAGALDRPVVLTMQLHAIEDASDTRRMDLELDPADRKSHVMLNCPTRNVSPTTSGPPSLLQVEHRPGDVLVLLAGCVHRDLGFAAGLLRQVAAARGPLTAEQLAAPLAEGSHGPALVVHL